MFSKKLFKFEDTTAKMVYKSQIKKNVETNSAGCNLMSLHNISRREVEKILILPRMCILSIELREFHFKPLHKILYTNKHLHIFRFHENGLCSFCKNVEQTNQHVFFQCNTIKEVWGECADRLNLPILKKLSGKEIHIGIDDSTIKTEQKKNIFLFLSNI